MVKVIKDLGEIPQDKKIIIDFFADWCGPCKRIAPEYVKLSEKYTDIEFYKCDIDEKPSDATATSLSELFEISSLPTFLFLVNSKVVNKLEGADIEGLKKLIEDLNNVKTETTPSENTKESSVCCKDTSSCDKVSCSCLKDDSNTVQ
jgi:thiol-disulfide isomerase/thioredoxin